MRNPNSITLHRQKVRSSKGKVYEYWQLRWYDPETGKRRTMALGRVDEMSRRQADHKRAQKQAEFEAKPFKRSSTGAPMLGEWCDEFIRMKRAEGVKPGTVVLYDFAKRLLIEFFGADRRLDQITKPDARRFATALRNNELDHVRDATLPKMSLVTARKHLVNCQAIFAAADAEVEEMLGNPFVVVKLPPVGASEWQTVDAATFWKVYDVATVSWKIVLAMCRMAGLRRSDALALRWQNVDFANGVLVFRQHKTGVDCRPPICPELLKILAAIPNKFEGDSFVVPRPVCVDNISRDFPALCKRAKVAPFRKPLHTLRKSCIDDWAKAGFPPSVVQAWAGHRDIKTTMTFYSKVDERDILRARQQAFLPREKQNDAKRDATA